MPGETTVGADTTAVAAALDVLPRIVRLITQASANAGDDPEPLTLTQYRLLKYLQGGPQLTTDLAAQLDVTPATVSAAIDCLVRRGMVERLVSTGDRRAVPLQSTALGQSALAAARLRQEAMLAEVFSGLSPEETGQLACGLRALRRALTELAGR